MWPPWRRSPRRSPSPAAAFSFSTFKDVQSLVSDDDDGKKPGSLHPAPRSAASVFRRVCSAAATLRTWSSLPAAASPLEEEEAIPPPPVTGKIVLYFTSLRVVRKTFEDCRAVRAILRGMRLVVDERDVSIERRFAAEMAPGPLPQLFIGGRWVGGADEIRQLNESGELRGMVAGFRREAAGDGPCARCGGARFVLCGACSGSHKCHLDKCTPGFRICPSCNENGLVRCPVCCADD